MPYWGDAGSPSQIVEDLVGPLPPDWPEGGLVGLIREEIPRRLPVTPLTYETLMAEDPVAWRGRILPLDGDMALSVGDRIRNVRPVKTLLE